MSGEKKKGVWRSLDWWTILIYMALLAFGWISICGASYDFEMGGDIFSFDYLRASFPCIQIRLFQKILEKRKFCCKFFPVFCD